MQHVKGAIHDVIKLQAEHPAAPATANLDVQSLDAKRCLSLLVLPRGLTAQPISTARTIKGWPTRKICSGAGLLCSASCQNNIAGFRGLHATVELFVTAAAKTHLRVQLAHTLHTPPLRQQRPRMKRKKAGKTAQKQESKPQRIRECVNNARQHLPER